MFEGVLDYALANISPCNGSVEHFRSLCWIPALFSGQGRQDQQSKASLVIETEASFASSSRVDSCDVARKCFNSVLRPRSHLLCPDLSGQTWGLGELWLLNSSSSIYWYPIISSRTHIHCSVSHGTSTPKSQASWHQPHAYFSQCPLGVSHGYSDRQLLV